jgi:hypothetical protein
MHGFGRRAYFAPVAPLFRRLSGEATPPHQIDIH